MVVAGGLLLLLGTVVGRPYCRFLCPYGVLLEWAARLAWRRTSITPANCIVCRLCESACPYDAIEKPEQAPKDNGLAGGAAWRLVAALALLPLLAAVGGWAGGRLGPRLGASHPTLQVANAILADQQPQGWLATTRVDAFAESGAPLEPFVAEARQTHLRLVGLGRGFGLFLGAAIGLQLVALARRVVHDDYRPDPGTCLSCGRCFRYCPVPPPAAGSQKSEVRSQRSEVRSQRSEVRGQRVTSS
jgi:NosR/NirI family transcriptional regulator, nitrous oxide reductase regulator